jgi:hypothetical protein
VQEHEPEQRQRVYFERFSIPKLYNEALKQKFVDFNSLYSMDALA